MGAGRPKALVQLAGRSLLAHALDNVLTAVGLTLDGDVQVVIVAPAGDVDEVVAEVDAVVGDAAFGGAAYRTRVQVVPGGVERTHSVALGLAALPTTSGGVPVDVVLVHDAARALTPAAVFDRVADAVRSGLGAVVPALPVVDTMKTVDPRPSPAPEPVVRTLDRSVLRAVQTPQGFTREWLAAAHAAAVGVATDDAGLVEALGYPVHTVAGDVRAGKITTSHDLDVARTWLPPGPPVLVVLGGLPAVGKTTIARGLARHRRAAHLRIDTVEQALVRSGTPGPIGPQGYAVATATAVDLLAGGVDVIADATHLLAVSRAPWIRAAEVSGATLLQVHLTADNQSEHRRRVRERVADIEGHQLPTWEQVERAVVEPWPEADLVLDTTTLPLEQILELIDRQVG